MAADQEKVEDDAAEGELALAVIGEIMEILEDKDLDDAGKIAAITEVVNAEFEDGDEDASH
jgi:hypothetical protein